MTRTLLRNLAFALTVDGTDRVIRDAAVLIDGEQIAAVGTTAEVEAAHSLERADAVVDARRFGIVPGFVDSHVHLSETLSRACFPDNLGTRAWVFHWAKPFYAHVGREDERVSVLLGTTEMLRCGTTCFLDMGSQHDAGITVQAAAEVGIRGATGRHAADVKPAEIPPGWTDEMIEHHFFPDAEAALEVLEDRYSAGTATRTAASAAGSTSRGRSRAARNCMWALGRSPNDSEWARRITSRRASRRPESASAGTGSGPSSGSTRWVDSARTL